jgi:hypothetical protein
MASHTRVTNLTTGHRIKRSQAANRVEQCLSEWVNEGFTIRDLALNEMVQRRSVQSQAEERLASAELPGIVYESPVSAKAYEIEHRGMVQAANQFADSQ